MLTGYVLLCLLVCVLCSLVPKIKKLCVRQHFRLQNQDTRILAEGEFVFGRVIVCVYHPSTGYSTHQLRLLDFSHWMQVYGFENRLYPL